MGLLDGKAIFVTGASRGIGAAAARRFADEGAAVLLMARDAAALTTVVDDILESGGTAVAVVGDVGDAEQVEAAVDRLVSEFGRLDGAFNNAGAAVPPTPLVDLGEEAFDSLFRTNQRAVWLCLRAEVRAMRATGTAGSIVNNSSVGSLYGNPGRGAYSATKRAVNSLTATAAAELGAEGIRVNAIAPGLTLTPLVREWGDRDPGLIERMTAQVPLGRAADPREIADAAAWLLSDRASYVTGVVLQVDGGLKA